MSQLCLNLEEFWDALAVAAGRFHPNLKKKINKKKKVKEKNTHTHTEREKDAKAFFPPTGKERRRKRERGNKEQHLRKSEKMVRELEAAKVSVPSGHPRPADRKSVV